jgi:hypothetical protein
MIENSNNSNDDGGDGRVPWARRAGGRARERAAG